MPQIIHSHRGKRSHYFKRTACHEKQLKDRKQEKKDGLRKSEKFNLIYEDFVIDYNHPEESAINVPNIKALQKRKLRNDDDYEWDWAPYPRRLKTQHDDESTFENSGYLSDVMEDSQIVPNWEDNVDDSVQDPKCADIHIVTIDEVIEFDSSKSPIGHDFEEEPICFDMEQICEIVGTEEVNEKGLTIDKRDVLLTFANTKPPMILYEESPIKLKGVKQMEPQSNLFDCNESSEDNVEDQWVNDCLVEGFKLARCFKCRQKVYLMQDCPRHIKKGTTIKK